MVLSDALLTNWFSFTGLKSRVKILVGWALMYCKGRLDLLMSQILICPSNEVAKLLPVILSQQVCNEINHFTLCLAAKFAKWQ